MNIELTATPLQLMAIALDTTGVLMGLGITTLLILGFIALRKNSQVKREDRERMLHKTGLNKGIGMISAIAIALIVMSWTTSHRNTAIGEGTVAEWDGEYPEEVQIIELEKQKTPPSITPPKLITDVFKIEDKKEPIEPTEPTEPKIGTENGTGKETVKVPGPIGPPKITTPPAKIVDEIKPDVPKLFVENMPRFCGCEDKEGDKEVKKICADNLMKRYLSQVVVYPQMAREAGAEGKVYIRFVVEKDGSISNIEIAKDATAGYGLGDAAKNAIIRMAKEKCWVAGQQGDEKARVRITIPVVFKIN